MDGERVYIIPKAGVYFGEVQVILEKGDMWDVFGETDLFLITTNPIIRKDGAVVMGRGIALEAKTRFPQLPYDFGRKLQRLNELQRTRKMGTIGTYDRTPVGYFMVKDHFAQEAKLSIIQQSVRDLMAYLLDGPDDYRVDLNFPGIGNGKLKREDVLPIIEQLPDNVHVWEYSHMDQKEFWEG